MAVKTFEKSKISEPQAQKRVAREVPVSLISVVPVAAASITVTVTCVECECLGVGAGAGAGAGTCVRDALVRILSWAMQVRILKALTHPHIIRLFEVVDEPYRRLIMMEYSAGGDLCRYVRDNRRLNESEAARLFVQIVDGAYIPWVFGICEE